MPCPPGELVVWEGCRNQQEEEEELEPPKRLCGVRSTHNSKSNPAPKMIQGTLLAVPPGGTHCVGRAQKPTSERDLGPRKRLCGVRNTYNFESNPAPKMI